MRVLVCCALGMAVATVGAQLQPAEVQYIGAESPLRAYKLGDECFVPIELLSTIGWDATLNKDIVTVKYAGLEHSFPHRTFAGSQSVPFRKAVTLFGGESEWDRIGRVLRARSIGKFTKGGLKFSLPVSATVIDGGKTLEIRGAKVVASPKDVPSGIRIQQAADGVRLVALQDKWPSTPGDARMEFELPGKVSEQTRPDRNAVPPKSANSNDLPPAVPPTQPTSLDPAGAPGSGLQNPDLTVPGVSNGIPLELELEAENALATLVKLKTVLPLVAAPQLRVTSPTTFEIEFSKTNVLFTPPQLAPGSDLKSVALAQVAENAVFTFTLPRPMGLEMWIDASGITLQLIKPNATGGHIAGKVIVIDPGHGGKDGGAKSGPHREKALTLAVSLQLAELLKAAGATVVMTRRTDEFIELSKRADIANRNRADFFISVHINSSAKPTTSGSITFFHGPNAMKELLARCIQTELAKIDGIPSIGVWSDKRIYKSGFAVLRQSRMPGVLLELGFINHPNDRARMIKPDYPQKAAQAVVNGLKEFIGDAKK